MDIVNTFKSIKENSGGNDVAAALLTIGYLTETGDLLDKLSHHICLGIRHGLFGIDAPERTSISGIGDIASALFEIDVRGPLSAEMNDIAGGLNAIADSLAKIADKQGRR